MQMNKIIPDHKILAWLNISVGDRAKGVCGENENIYSSQGDTIPLTVRYRQHLLSLDIDLTKIKTNSKALKSTFKDYLSLNCHSLSSNLIRKVR